MKFTAEPKELASAAAWAVKGLSRYCRLPVLGGVRVSASHGAVTLGVFDFEHCFLMRIAADVTEPGEALVPGRELAGAVRALPKTRMTVQLDGGTPARQLCELHAGPSALSLGTLPLDEYPAYPPLPPLAGIADAAHLTAALRQVLPAVSRDDTLPVLTCVRLEPEPGGIRLIATDRYRLHVSPVRLAAGEPFPAVNVPAVPLSHWAKASRAGKVQVHADGERVAFTDGTRTIVMRSNAGMFPSWRSLLRSSGSIDSHLTADASALAAAVRRIGKLAERETPVRLTADDSGTVTVETTAGAVSGETLPGSRLDGEPVRQLFAHRYLADALEAFSGDVTVHMSAATGKIAMFTSEGSDCQVAVVTVREPA